MTDKTDADRMARNRQRDRQEKGVVGVLVLVHHTRKAEIKAIAAGMQVERGSEREAKLRAEHIARCIAEEEARSGGTLY